MKVLTLNINFKGLIPERIQKIIALILQHEPTIIFLQEIPHQMIDKFQIPNYPYRFGEEFQHQYNTLILSRYQCLRYDRIPLPNTSMGRNLLLAQIVLPSGKRMNVGTFHMESVFNLPESEVLKMNQLRFIHSIIPRTIPFIIAGDTNLLDNQESSIDNCYEQDSPPTFNRKRFDRIFTNLPVEESPKLIGDRTHSDHSGLVIIINPVSQ
jgi:endonuclease/exonuclease/phosphatase family metal-dependent hydrolase